MIQIKDMSKMYGKKEILANINLEINSGDFIAIMGKSGSGKTTLLNILGFLDSKTTGKYILDGIDTETLSRNEKSNKRSTKTAYILQGYGLINSYSVYENLEVPLDIKNMKKSNRKEVIEKALKEVDLENKIYDKISNLSGGEKQRVAIARTLISNCDIILADEPTGNLDKENTDKIMQLFLNLNKKRNKTVILVTHSDEVARYCDKIYTLEKGILKENPNFKK